MAELGQNASPGYFIAPHKSLLFLSLVHRVLKGRAAKENKAKVRV